MLSSSKRFKISAALLSIHNIIIIAINLFRQVFNVSVCYAQQEIFVIACAFDIMQCDNMLQKFLIAVIAVARHYQRELPNLPPIRHLPVNKSQ